ncbi:hypothetical protein BJP36_38630 [Moorena producens JHB]|uniref:Uncharacterized protein n=1 Tax=Moorena producens (strain JHB) TaxID=1454205 RepID=A0A9Q9SUN3_MOOP1|nr:hypothetical protein [Moorena producens]WAN69989.1 hypothetical protein BJP36_38630 [Moorena producens JHB]
MNVCSWLTINRQPSTVNRQPSTVKPQQKTTPQQTSQQQTVNLSIDQLPIS